MTAEIDSIFAKGLAKLKGGDPGAAEALFQEAHLKFPGHPVALFLMGMMRLNASDFSKAELLFRRALAISPDQPAVCIHLARALRAQERTFEAIPFYEAAISAEPDKLELRLELAQSLDACDRFIEAQAAYLHILDRRNDPQAGLGLGAMLNRMGHGPDAEAVLRRALACADAMGDDMRAELEYQLGLSLRKQRRHSEALPHVIAARSRRSQPDRRIAMECANIFQHLGRLSEASEIYSEMIRENPLDMDAHIFLNEILYRGGETRPDALFASYDVALKAAPQAAILPATKAYYLLKLRHTALALEEYQRALSLDPGLSIARTGTARALEMLGEVEKAHEAHRESVLRSPEVPGVLEDYTCFLLRHYSAQEACTFAERACRLRPTSQGAWAVLSLCYRAAHDAREGWLNDYEKHVQVFDLDPPAGYPDMESFNQELAEYLASLHTDRREYLSQTLRNGTRLYDEAFCNGHPLIDMLLPRFLEAMSSYCSSWTEDADHPFSSRRTDGFRMGGSWSSRALPGGYHVNHIHPAGWISSSYYVSVPKAVDGDTQHAGWIQFGQPSDDFGSAFSPCRFVKPKPGRLLLFPSYVWHGTVAFSGLEPRMTIAFDALPG